MKVFTKSKIKAERRPRRTSTESRLQLATEDGGPRLSISLGEALDTTNIYSLISFSVWFYVITMFYDCLLPCNLLIPTVARYLLLMPLG
uniref:Pecanex-like protein n=1 Tax=Haemonchus contortus TaxID=6289 RepID=A0A7I4Z655_HAECO